MKIEIDTELRTLSVDGAIGDLYSDAAFRTLSTIWNKVGWNQKYPYTFTWFGIPIIQSPEDMIRYQEVIFNLRPDVIVETGIAHGGSAVFSASLLRLLGKGRVIAVDIEIRSHNRSAIEAHPMKPYITLLEGSSVSKDIVDQVRNQIKAGEKVMVVLDSNHSYDHVTSELEAYAPMVSVGSYLVSTDGSMRELHDVPRGKPEWRFDNPAQAALDFAARHPEFIIETPGWRFNESNLADNITHWPDAWLKRIA